MYENLISYILSSLKLNDWIKIFFSLVIFSIVNLLILKWLSKEEKNILNQELNRANHSTPHFFQNNNLNQRHLDKKKRIEELSEKQKRNAKLARQARREACESKKRLNELKQELYQKKIDEKVLKKLLEKKKEEEAKHKEYEKWKRTIKIEEAGSELNFEDELLNLEYMKISNFINAIITRKVVYINDLSAEFHLSVDDVISRIKELEDQKLIDGVLTDKGEYIYIEDEEWNSIYKYIEEKGIISKSEDLVSICNKVIQIKS